MKKIVVGSAADVPAVKPRSRIERMRCRARANLRIEELFTRAREYWL